VIAFAADTPHSVRDGAGRRWPVADGIPFLRLGREALADEALARLDAGDREGALTQLLADQDAWWRGDRAEPAALRELVRRSASLTLREAMRLLSWGPVADYFAHRWSDPTFLSGLALVEAHWRGPRTAFELACGIGHHLREWSRRGVRAAGADVVFAKLWIARHWVAPEAELACFDAGLSWPLAPRAFDLVACHDAFYFLEPKPAILVRLRAHVAPLRGVLAISHVHNRDWPNLSSGAAMTAAEVADAFPRAALYDDAELTRALVDRRAPRPAAASADLAGVEAFSLAEGPDLAPAQPIAGRLALPPEGSALRRNPLYAADGAVAWPSERYAREYGPHATYPARTDCPERATSGAATAAWALRRELLDLPERW
jgi:SAM-dependent methyltransferase